LGGSVIKWRVLGDYKEQRVFEQIESNLEEKSGASFLDFIFPNETSGRLSGEISKSHKDETHPLSGNPREKNAEMFGGEAQVNFPISKSGQGAFAVGFDRFTQSVKIIDASDLDSSSLQYASVISEEEMFVNAETQTIKLSLEYSSSHVGWDALAGVTFNIKTDKKSPDGAALSEETTTGIEPRVNFTVRPLNSLSLHLNPTGTISQGYRELTGFSTEGGIEGRLNIFSLAGNVSYFQEKTPFFSTTMWTFTLDFVMKI